MSVENERGAVEAEAWQWSSALYRSVGHWDCLATVNHDGERYPCRLMGCLVGHFEVDGPDTGTRIWGAQALGLPSRLSGQVTVTIAGVCNQARLDDGQLTGKGVPWLLAEEPTS
jgi:hypothetical protein